jgi:uncharacterized protein (DUF2336 family)
LTQSTAALEDIARAIGARDEASRARSADMVTDLFVSQAPSFDDDHIALFDKVIGLLADAIEVRARARLAEKLADIPNAPHGVIRRLAVDDIAVARPVLARSPRLSDQDLIAAARARGRDHMLAISERSHLSNEVTDVLVAEGDRVVVNAVASNPTASFSETSYDALVERAAADALLHAAIARRRDIPSRHMATLFDLAKKAARERLQNDLTLASRRAVRDAVNASARDIAAEALDHRSALDGAMNEVVGLMEAGSLNPAAIAEMARHGREAQTICGLALMAQTSLDLADRSIARGDHDLLLTIARTVDLEWDVVRLLLGLRKEHKPGPRQFELLADSYQRLTGPTAQRLLRYIQAREAAAASQRLTKET